MALNIHFILGIIAGVISACAYVIYIRSILKGESKPSRVTWWIWTFMGAVLAASYYASGARDTIWSPIVEFIGPLITALLAIKYGEGGIESKTDILCFVGGVISIGIWVLFKTPKAALIINLIIDGFAIFPTIKKSYLRPEGENIWAWAGTALGDGINTLAIEQPYFAIIIYPVWMLTLDLSVITGLILGKNRQGKRMENV
ncbi:MAG: hypothetical protein JWL75_436 [Parcubacteria group bacterium]|nr:hypothetical protein [Parcubacteria group bacterium]